MPKVFMKVDGVPGNSTDQAHLGWIELYKLEVIPNPTKRRAPVVGTLAVPPIHVSGWSVIGPHSLELRAAWITGKDFAWAVLEVVHVVNNKSVVKNRLRMTAVGVMSYQLNNDRGLVKPVSQFVLVPTAYIPEAGPALLRELVHEQPHAGSGASTAAGAPLRRPIPKDRSPPTGKP